MSRLAIAARFGRRPLLVAASALLGLAFVSSAMAQEATTEDQLADIVGAVDTLWLLLAAFMVFLMQAGFALVEAGFVRAKNTSNILMKNVLDCCMYENCRISSILCSLIGCCERGHGGERTRRAGHQFRAPASARPRPAHGHVRRSPGPAPACRRRQ